MKVLVIGDKGVMGSRYTAILKYLGHDVLGHDVVMGNSFSHDLKDVTHAIVATPTASHIDSVLDLCMRRGSQLNILCEKPITTDLFLTERLFTIVGLTKSKLFSVNQYVYLPESHLFDQHDWATSYNNFRSGKDGLAWDCFTIIGLARGPITLSNTSPVWKCSINGINIDIRGMDRAYIDMIHDFLGDQELVWGKDKVLEVTKKVGQYIDGTKWALA